VGCQRTGTGGVIELHWGHLLLDATILTQIWNTSSYKIFLTKSPSAFRDSRFVDVVAWLFWLNLSAESKLDTLS
jgi:hypothetical protein